MLAALRAEVICTPNLSIKKRLCQDVPVWTNDRCIEGMLIHKYASLLLRFAGRVNAIREGRRLHLGQPASPRASLHPLQLLDGLRGLDQGFGDLARFRVGALLLVQVLRPAAAAAKVRQQRIIPPERVSLERLRICKDLRMALPRSIRCRALPDAQERMGWSEWPADVVRHTAASYLLAHHQDADRVPPGIGEFSWWLT